MLTVKQADSHTQMRLLDEPDLIKFPSMASARTRYGEAAEQIAITALRAQPITIDGRYDVCFDAQRGKTFFEIKSVRRNGECPIYNWRIRKDADSGKQLLYAFVLHGVRGVGDTHELWSAMASTVKAIVLAPLWVVAGLHARSKLEHLSDSGNLEAANGYNREGYREGYRRIKMSALLDMPASVKGRRFALNGHRFNMKIVEVLP